MCAHPELNDIVRRRIYYNPNIILETLVEEEAILSILKLVRQFTRRWQINTLLFYAGMYKNKIYAYFKNICLYHDPRIFKYMLINTSVSTAHYRNIWHPNYLFLGLIAGRHMGEAKSILRYIDYADYYNLDKPFYLGIDRTRGHIVLAITSTDSVYLMTRVLDKMHVICVSGDFTQLVSKVFILGLQLGSIKILDYLYRRYNRKIQKSFDIIHTITVSDEDTRSTMIYNLALSIASRSSDIKLSLLRMMYNRNLLGSIKLAFSTLYDEYQLIRLYDDLIISSIKTNRDIARLIITNTD